MTDDDLKYWLLLVPLSGVVIVAIAALITLIFV